MDSLHLTIFAVLIVTGIGQLCPYTTRSYSGPVSEGMNSCFQCINTNNITNNSLCRTCDPITRTVGNPTNKSSGTCPCFAVETVSPCYPFSVTFNLTIELSGKNAILSWRTVENFRIGNGTELHSITGYRISIKFANNLIFNVTIPSEVDKLDYTLSYSAPRFNVTYVFTTEIEAMINNNLYLGLPLSQAVKFEELGPTTATLPPNTLSPGAESAIITSGVVLLIIFIVAVVAIFLCTVLFPYRVCRRREPFTLNLESANPRLQRVRLDLNDGFSAMQGGIELEGLTGENVEQGELTCFINPYLVGDSQSVDSGSIQNDH